MDNRNTVRAVAAGCCVLTLIFLIAGFPYDRLESRVVRGIEHGSGGKMTFAASEQSFGLTGPVYEWRGVTLTGLAKQPLNLDRLRARLAWSLSWLRLAPAFHVEFEGKVGAAKGVVSLGSRPGFDGTLEQFDLSVLPRDWNIAGVGITGMADAELDMTGGEQWMGDIELVVTGGSLSGGKLRDGLPFNKLTGTLHLAGDHRTEISALHVVSPLLKADLSGSIGPADTAGAAPLNLALELDAEIRALALLRGFGIRMSKKGTQSLTVSGTVDAPQVR